MKNRNTYRRLVAAVVLVSCLATTIPTMAAPRILVWDEIGTSGWWSALVTFVTTLFANETAANETDGADMDPNGRPTSMAPGPRTDEPGFFDQQ